MLGLKLNHVSKRRPRLQYIVTNTVTIMLSFAMDYSDQFMRIEMRITWNFHWMWIVIETLYVHKHIPIAYM